MTYPTQPWKLIRFGESLDAWIERDKPSEDLSYVVTEWVFTRDADPYQGAHRVEGIPNLWQMVVPGSAHGTGTGQVVFCSYWIEESQHMVRCDNIATLNWPV